MPNPKSRAMGQLPTNRVIWMYWEDRNNVSKPSYLNLCLESIRLHCGTDFEIVLLNPANIEDYVSDIHPNWHKLLVPAHKADYIRCKALFSHGGIWLDSDIIAFHSLISWYKELDRYDFIGYEWNGLDPSIGAFIARKDSPLLEAWLKGMEQKLDRRAEFDWCELGYDVLHPIVEKFASRGHLYCFFKARETVAPIAWDEASKFFEKGEIDIYMRNNQPLIILYNAVFPDWFKKMTEKEILEGETIISKLFRVALNQADSAFGAKLSGL